MKKVAALVLFIMMIFGTISSSAEPLYAADKVAAPKGVSVEANKSGNPVISWDEVEGATKYRVYRKTADDSSWVKVVTTSKLNTTDKKWSADEGTTISYVVKASAKIGSKTVWSKNSKAVKWTVPVKEVKKSNTDKSDKTEKKDKTDKGGEADKSVGKYVLNTNTKKIHYPSCRDVEKIKKENYATTNESIESLINKDYSPCKHCNPE